MGRRLEFEPEEAVAKAMEVFWRNGYEGTSVQDLVDHTGVNRASLYAQFTDKHTLYLAAMKHYRQVVVPTRAGILQRPDAGMAEIREYFAMVADDLARSTDGRGCLMVNSTVELAAHDRAIRKEVREHLKKLELAFAGALKRARERGEIRSTVDVEATAQFLMAVSQGLMVVGKAVRDRTMLDQIVAHSLAGLEAD